MRWKFSKLVWARRDCSRIARASRLSRIRWVWFCCKLLPRILFSVPFPPSFWECSDAGRSAEDFACWEKRFSPLARGHPKLVGPMQIRMESGNQPHLNLINPGRDNAYILSISPCSASWRTRISHYSGPLCFCSVTKPQFFGFLPPRHFHARSYFSFYKES